MLLIFVSHAKNLGDHAQTYAASALILVMISGFRQDFRISRWISGFQVGFLDFKLDFWISR